MFASRTFWLILTAFTVVFTGYLLITGSGWLEYPLWNHPYIPLGTFIAWAGLSAFPALFYFALDWQRPKRSSLSTLYILPIRVSLVMGLAWGMVSLLLAGNLNFSFSGGNGYWTYSRVWRIYTVMVLVLPIVALILWGLYFVLIRIIRR